MNFKCVRELISFASFLSFRLGRKQILLAVKRPRGRKKSLKFFFGKDHSRRKLNDFFEIGSWMTIIFPCVTHLNWWNSIEHFRRGEQFPSGKFLEKNSYWRLRNFLIFFDQVSLFFEVPDQKKRIENPGVEKSQFKKFRMEFALFLSQGRITKRLIPGFGG